MEIDFIGENWVRFVKSVFHIREIGLSSCFSVLGMVGTQRVGLKLTDRLEADAPFDW